MQLNYHQIDDGNILWCKVPICKSMTCIPQSIPSRLSMSLYPMTRETITEGKCDGNDSVKTSWTLYRYCRKQSSWSVGQRYVYRLSLADSDDLCLALECDPAICEQAVFSSLWWSLSRVWVSASDICTGHLKRSLVISVSSWSVSQQHVYRLSLAVTGDNRSGSQWRVLATLCIKLSSLLL